MKILVHNESNIIYEIEATICMAENIGFVVETANGSIIYPIDNNLSIYEVDIPSEVSKGKYCYTTSEGFYKNDFYREYVRPEERIAQLEQQISDLNHAMAAIMGGAY